MAKATKKTERVEKVIYEDKDVINVEMTPEEAHAVFRVLWLIEMEKVSDPYVAFKGVQDAIATALDFPVAMFRSDSDHRLNTLSSVYIYERD